MGKQNENLDGYESNVFDFFLHMFISMFKCLLGATYCARPRGTGVSAFEELTIYI